MNVVMDYPEEFSNARSNYGTDWETFLDISQFDETCASVTAGFNYEPIGEDPRVASAHPSWALCSSLAVPDLEHRTDAQALMNSYARHETEFPVISSPFVQPATVSTPPSEDVNYEPCEEDPRVASAHPSWAMCSSPAVPDLEHRTDAQALMNSYACHETEFPVISSPFVQPATVSSPPSEDVNYEPCEEDPRMASAHPSWAMCSSPAVPDLEHRTDAQALMNSCACHETEFPVISSPFVQPATVSTPPSEDVDWPQDVCLLLAQVLGAPDSSISPLSSPSLSEPSGSKPLPAQDLSGFPGHKQSRRRKRSQSNMPVPVPSVTNKARGRKVPKSLDGQPVHGLSVDKAKGGVRSFCCEVQGCNAIFVRCDHLKRHIRSIHMHEQPWHCPNPGCGQRFKRKDNLKTHLRKCMHITPSLPS